jgi:hypothetical protein
MVWSRYRYKMCAALLLMCVACSVSDPNVRSLNVASAATQSSSPLDLPLPVTLKGKEAPARIIVPNAMRPVHYAVREAYGRIDLQPIKESSDIIMPQVGDVLMSSLNFLFQNFGPALHSVKAVELEVVDDSSDHDFMSLMPDGRRRVRVNYRHILDKKLNEFVIHELFHAFYQSDCWVRKGAEFELEGWAMYAQTISRNRESDGDNSEMHARAVRDFPRATDVDFVSLVRQTPFQSFNPGDRQAAYISAALPLLGLTRQQVYAAYSTTLEGYDGCSRAGQAPGAAKARPPTKPVERPEVNRSVGPPAKATPRPTPTGSEARGP